MGRVSTVKISTTYSTSLRVRRRSRCSTPIPLKPFTPSMSFARERISRSLLYALWQQGRGPRYYLAGTHRRITEQARQDWHRHLEAEAATGLPKGRE